jgi:hypothetical protein
MENMIIAKALFQIACNFAPVLIGGALSLAYLWFTEQR